MSENNNETRILASSARYLWVAALAAAIGIAAVYVTRPPTDNAPNTINAPGSTNPDRLDAGEMAAFIYQKAPKLLPEVAFTDGSAAPMKLSDFKGKVVLLNLWATWCTPCRTEMPGLDQLQAELGGDDFEVVALSIDRGGIEASKKFLEQIHTKNLKLYVDPTTKAGRPLKVVGMPTTLLINKQGREIGRLVGPAEWNSADAKRLIRAAIE